MLTTFDLDEYVHPALRAGAVGFLLKDTPPLEFAAAVRTVAAGEAMLVAVGHPAADRLVRRARSGPREARRATASPSSPSRSVTSSRPWRAGLSNAEIGRELIDVGGHREGHVSRALAKLGLGNRVQAAILVHDAGLL